MDKYRFWACAALFLMALAMLFGLVDITVWRDQGAAAWAQAIGTVIAIIGTAAGVRYQTQAAERTRLREKVLEAQGLAILLGPLTKLLHGKVTAAQNEEWLENHPVEIPGAILSRLDRLWIMGGAGGNLLQAVAALQANNAFIAACDGGAALNPEEYGQAVANSRRSLALACEECDEASEQIMILIAHRP
jgi:uncharacterized protein YqfA (UPF0365 family)